MIITLLLRLITCGLVPVHGDVVYIRVFTNVDYCAIPFPIQSIPSTTLLYCVNKLKIRHIIILKPNVNISIS